jgi:NTE family protein
MTDVKRALVLSGGGAKGAYEVGALLYLYGDLENQYDIICGVSVGALNGSFLAQYLKKDEKSAINGLLDLWNSIDTRSIYKRWFFGYLSSLWRSSVYNSEPLQKLVRGVLSQAAIQLSGKELRVGAVSLNSGIYKLFDQNYHDLAGAVLASASFPVMLCPIKLDGELWTDGGIRDVTPLAAAIDLQADEVDIIVTSPDYTAPHPSHRFNVLDLAWRSVEVMSDEIINNDLHKAISINKMISAGFFSNKRKIPIRIIRPSSKLIDNSLDFSQATIQEMIKTGYEDAKRVCENVHFF